MLNDYSESLHISLDTVRINFSTEYSSNFSESGIVKPWFPLMSFTREDSLYFWCSSLISSSETLIIYCSYHRIRPTHEQAAFGK